MNKIKSIIVGFLIIIFMLTSGPTLVAKFSNYFFKAIKWVVLIDNAETGLSWQWEMLVKVLVESIIMGIATGFGLSRDNPILTIISIVLGFTACMLTYFVAKYILWILSFLGVIILGIVAYFIVRKIRGIA